MSESPLADADIIAEYQNKMERLFAEDPQKAIEILLAPELLRNEPDEMLLDLFRIKVELRTAERLRKEAWVEQACDKSGWFQRLILMLKIRFFGLADRLIQLMLEPVFDELAEHGPLRDAMFARPNLHVRNLVLQWYCSAILIRGRPVTRRTGAFNECVDELVLLAKSFGLDSRQLSLVKHRHDNDVWDNASAVVDEIRALAQIKDLGTDVSLRRPNMNQSEMISQFEIRRGSDQIDAHVHQLLDDARQRLLQCYKLLKLQRSHPLRDPERNNANFVHPKTGTEYNCRAAETYLVIDNLAAGTLTEYPLGPPKVEPKPEPPLMSTTSQFDVFLCHNSRDKSIVKDIALQLKQRGLRPWLDEWQLRPGLPWQRALEQQIDSIGAAAVFVGPDGFGPWQQMEQEAFLREFVNRGCPVIPVILPGVQTQPDLPKFLKGMTWVDFRSSAPNPLDSLIWGITGANPNP